MDLLGNLLCINMKATLNREDETNRRVKEKDGKCKRKSSQLT